MACGDVLSLEDLQTAKKHQIFEAEVITGKAGGAASGATIGTATNQVTGQTQQTLPSILADLGFDVQSWTSSTGGVLASANQVFLNDTPGSLGLGDYYAWGGTFPKTVPAGTDPALPTSGYVMRSSRFAGTQAREGLRRSYAEAGYNLVAGSFEAGGTLVSANDVLLQERTGKAFSGPAGPVAAGTNPASGGFTDRSDELSIASRTFRSFGATGLGFAGDAQALQDAIDWAGAKEGRRVYGNPGDIYRIDFGLVLRRDGKELFDQTSACTIDFTGTKLVPNVDNIICFAVERNYATVIRPVVDNRAARTGVSAYLLGPVGLDSETTKTDVMFSEWTRPMAMRCKTAFVFQPGPTVGSASGMYYHTLYSPYVYGCEKGFHFRRCITGDNKATRISIYSPRQIYGNCMFDIDNAETLDVYSGTAEFVNDPGEYSNKPTIKITKQGADPYDNSFIRFHNFVGERGGVPFDFDGSCFYNSLINPTFVNYDGKGVYSVTSDPYGQITNFEGPVYSQAQYGLGTRPRIGAAVRPGAGTKAGQVFLEWEPAGSSPYNGRLVSSDGLEVVVGAQGLKVTGQVRDISAENIQNKSYNRQVLGTTACRIEVLGDTDKNVKIYNTEVSPSGTNGFLFGGVTFRYLSPYESDNLASLGRPSSRWSVVYAGTGAINTSDAREKTAPQAIDDALLDAWGDVQLITFKWLESTRLKGEDSARWHFGVIAQQVRDAFAAHGLDGTHYGLLCYDEWGDEFEDVLDEAGHPTGEIKQVQVAGNRWGIRPEQCLFVEAAYQRRNYERLLERVEALENK